MKQLNKLAFTLIELLVVIAVIGILSGLIVVSMNGTIDRATIAKAQVFSNSLKNSLLSNLVSEWKLDDVLGSSAPYTTSDSWSGGGTGTLMDGASNACSFTGTLACPQKLTSNCVYDNCFSFDGSNDNVDFGDKDSFSFGNGTTDFPFSLSLWIYKNTNASGGPISKGTDSSIGEYYLYFTNGNSLYFRIIDNSAAAYLGVFSSFSDNMNKWTNVVATYSGGKTNSDMRLYFNGVLQSTTNSNALTYVAMENTANSLVLGRREAYFSGRIDDVRIYNTAMPTSKIKEQYYLGLNSLFANGGITKEEYLSRINSIAVNE